MCYTFFFAKSAKALVGKSLKVANQPIFRATLIKIGLKSRAVNGIADATEFF